MEKTCEFCTVLRPVVYCKADAAHLCLLCDARVHSANALSSRHVRTLLCLLCKYRPAYFRCVDHRMFLCRGCDRSLHGFSSQHQKQVLNTYTGCPSPKDFAALWDCDSSILDNGAIDDQLASSSGSGVDSEAVSSSQQRRMHPNGQNQQDSSIIFQQILDLKRHQVNKQKQNNNESLIRGKEQTDFSSSRYDISMKLDGDIDQFSQHFLDIGIGTDLQTMNSSDQVLKEDPCPSPFSQLHNISSCSTVEIPSHGDTFWHSKIPADSSQLWSQNMQDLGFCEEFDCFDDVNIPDVDPTFHNFEELFGGEQNPPKEMLDDKDVTCSSSTQNSISLDKSDDGFVKAFESASAASSINNSLSAADKNKDMGASNQVHCTRENVDSPFPRQSSYLSMSYSFSRLSSESSGTVCFDTGVSPLISTGEPSSDLPDLCTAQCKGIQTVMTRFKEKKVLMHEKQKQIRYLSQKASAGVKKRVKDQSIKAEGYESDGLSVTRSY